MTEPAGVEPNIRAYAVDVETGATTPLDTPEAVREWLGLPEPGSVQEQIARVLANFVDPNDEAGGAYLDVFEAMELAAAVMREVVRPLVDEHTADVARLTRELDDERGSHAMTRHHFTGCSEDWTAAIRAQRQKIARLTELLDAAQLARDKAQAKVTSARVLAETWRTGRSFVGPDYGDHLDAVLDHAGGE